MPQHIKTDLVIIGAGIAGLSLALRARKHGLTSVILDDNREGTTYAATGLVAPRVDYMLKDIDLVRMSDKQCRQLCLMFPHLIGPQKFIIPIEPGRPLFFRGMERLLKYYDRQTPWRRIGVPASSRITRKELETEEPSIRKNFFNGALVFWEFMIDPAKFMTELGRLVQLSDNTKRVSVLSGSLRCHVRDRIITEVKSDTIDGGLLKIRGAKRAPVVVNTAGPWSRNVAQMFGCDLDINFRLGIQAKIEAELFNSGIIAFDGGNHYCVFLSKNGYTQVGPTNTAFHGNPDRISASLEDLGRLSKILSSVAKTGKKELQAFKSGLRVKPNFGETDRPMIWSHRRDGIDNFYTMFPGKMSLGFLAAEDVLRIINRDGHYQLDVMDFYPKCALEGNMSAKNKVFLVARRFKSLTKVSWNILRN